MDIPCVTPAGGLGAILTQGVSCPISRRRTIPPGLWRRLSSSPPACAAWNAARFPASATKTARTFWRCGTLRLAFPRRVFTLSQVKYVADRMKWLYDNRDLIGGLEFVEEPPSCASSWASSAPRATGLKNWRPNTAGTSGKACKGCFSVQFRIGKGWTVRFSPLLRWGACLCGHHPSMFPPESGRNQKLSRPCFQHTQPIAVAMSRMMRKAVPAEDFFLAWGRAFLDTPPACRVPAAAMALI